MQRGNKYTIRQHYMERANRNTRKKIKPHATIERGQKVETENGNRQMINVIWLPEGKKAWKPSTRV